MKAYVIDTNIPVVANGRGITVGAECVSKCQRMLLRLIKKYMIVIDGHGLILGEYKRRLSFSGQPGVGDYFFKWLFDNQFREKKCERVQVRYNPDDETNLDDFPDESELNGFDPSDRKFVVVALGSKNRPKIMHATDRGWLRFEAALSAHGITIEHLCE